MDIAVAEPPSSPLPQLGADRVVEVTDDPDDPPTPGVERVSAREFLSGPPGRAAEGGRLINRCRDLRYGSAGYYATLVGEARGYTVVPSLVELVSPRRLRRALEGTRGWAVAILWEPDDRATSSNPPAIQRFVEQGRSIGLCVDVIGLQDAHRLAEFDALFVRLATTASGPVFWFMRQAEALGLVLLDSVVEIAEIFDKAWQAERFARADIPTPRTLLLCPQDAHIAETLGYPLVLKRPYGSSSEHVLKVSEASELRPTLDRLLQGQALAVAQEWVPTAFDWRVGVLDGEVLFTCRYPMAPGHWQINHWVDGVIRGEGTVETVPPEEAPKAVKHVALQAASLLGDSFYGVDIKEVDGRALVIEVNDVPNVYQGEEDALLGDELYRRVMASLARRIGRARELGVP